MLDVFARIVSQADAKGEFLNRTQIDGIKRIVNDGNKRLDTVNRITGNASAIVADTARQLFAEQPQLIQPGGNAYTNRRMAACIRDMEIILRYVTYAMLAGDSSILDDRCLNGLRQTYEALGVPGRSVADAAQIMKNRAIQIANDPNDITRGDCSNLMSELANYFDRASAAVA